MIKTHEQIKLDIAVEAFDKALYELDAELAKLPINDRYIPALLSAKMQGIVNFMRGNDDTTE